MAVTINPSTIKEGDRYSELSPHLLKALSVFFKEYAPDIVHVNGLKSASIKICKDLKIRNVVTAHHPGFVCPAGDLLRPDDSLCVEIARPRVCVSCYSRRKTAIPMAGALLGAIPAWLYMPAGRFLDRFRKISRIGRGAMFPWLVEKALEGQKVRLKDSGCIISPSKAMKELLVRNGVIPEKIFIVPHGIEPLPRLPLPCMQKGFVKFGYLGRIDRDKGFHLLLKALEMVSPEPNCELHVFGAAQNFWDNAFLEECVPSYMGNARIVQHGPVPIDKLADAYAQFDVLILPSIYLEVFGLVILEAFSAGRPVIVTKSGGPEEIVRDGVDGIIVERNSAAAIAEAMQRLLRDPGHIRKMANNIAHVRTIQEHVNDIEKVYERIFLTSEVQQGK